MILLLGATSYVGQAFARELRARGECFIPLSRSALDYARFELLFEYVRKIKPDFVINASGIWGNSDTDSSEHVRTEIFQANTLLPQTVGRVCLMTNISWGHVSSACIYNGAKVFEEGRGARGEQRGLRVETDLNNSHIRRLYAKNPENFLGFNELDDPNFCFRLPPCSYTAGTKALAEEWLRGRDKTYIWRLGIPFDEFDSPFNLLSKLQSYTRVFDHFAALSHLSDFVRGCLHLVERNASFGIYNITNPGAVTTREIVEIVQRKLKPGRHFKFWKSETEFSLNTMRSPQSSCILDSSKLMRAGIKLRPARVAIEHALEHWQPARGPTDSHSPSTASDDGAARIVRLVQRG